MSLLKRIGTTSNLGAGQDDEYSQQGDGDGSEQAESYDSAAQHQEANAGTRSLNQLSTQRNQPSQSQTTSTLRRPGTAVPTNRSDSFTELKSRVQNRLIAELDPRMDLTNPEEVRRTVEETFTSVLESEAIVLTRVERMRLFEAISAEILGFGPIEPLLNDEIGRAHV